MEDILFLDIETVPVAESFEELSAPMQELWVAKSGKLKNEDNVSAEELYFDNAGVYAEFAKVVCISVGFIHNGTLRLKSVYGDDEKAVLDGFSVIVNKFMRSASHKICGHNIKEFDIPFISRRMLINGVKIPHSINVMGKKPWETNFLDTMEMWKFGDFKSYTSLKTLTTVFGIPSPKDDIDGSEVAGVYYFENDLERIARYCEKDVNATAQVYLRMCGLPMVEKIEIV